MADRRSTRAELERKKNQLAQMKLERERRSRLMQEQANQPGASSQLLNSDLGQGDGGRFDDADSVIRALGLSAALSRTSTVPSNISSMDQSRFEATSPDANANQSTSALNESLLMQSSPRPAAALQVVQVNQVNIRPIEKVYYAKSTQTFTPQPAAQTESHVGSGDAVTSTDAANATGEAQQLQPYYFLTYDEDEQWSDFSDTPNGGQNKSTSTAPVGLGQPNQEPGARQSNPKPKPLREMNDEERKQVELRDDYKHFIERATKILERALHRNESSEIFIQYFPDGDKDAIGDERRKGGKLSFDRIFFDDRWSRNRCVTGFDWSAQYPELLLASYYTNERVPSDFDGVALVWNMRFKNTSPEYVFNCQSPIVSCCFARFHPSLVVSGTYSGQIVLWDMRVNKKTPVQRSPLTAGAHTHPVYCAKVVGTQNAHNLITISTDGKLCSWSLDMLSSPQETMELGQQKQTRSVAVTCMSFHPDDYNNFLIGSEEGTVYSACRHGSKTGVLSSFESHQGLVTSVDYRPVHKQTGYSHQFLTSSIDWTVKLWDSKQSEPLQSFESNSDYVYDVKWCPANADLFATADGEGRVDVWNVNDSELPIASTHVETTPSSGGTAASGVAGTGSIVGTGASDSKNAQPSLNKLIWTPNGNQVVVGDDIGRIHVYDTGEMLKTD